MGISSKQVTMVTAQGEEWLHELCRSQIVVTDFVLKTTINQLTYQ